MQPEQDAQRSCEISISGGFQDPARWHPEQYGLNSVLTILWAGLEMSWGPLHPGCVCVCMTACVYGLGDLQQGRRGDRSQVILGGIREEFLGLIWRVWSSTEVWVRRVSGLLLPVPGHCEGGVDIRFDEQPFHSLPAQCSAKMTMCFGHKLHQATEYSVSNFVLTQVLKHFISTLLHIIRYNFLLLINLKKRYLPQAKMCVGKTSPIWFVHLSEQGSSYPLPMLTNCSSSFLLFLWECPFWNRNLKIVRKASFLFWMCLLVTLIKMPLNAANQKSLKTSEDQDAPVQSWWSCTELSRHLPGTGVMAGAAVMKSERENKGWDWETLLRSWIA